jgi:hypothetical protein
MLLLLPACLLAMGRKEAKELHSKTDTTITTGVTGRVEIWIGNFMPMVDPARGKGQIQPGSGLKVRAYPPIKVDGGMAAAHRDSILASVAAETVTDSTGHFFLPLIPGDYSVFVEDGTGWYYNGFNGDGVQGAVTVKPGIPAEILIKNTTKAIF